MPELLVAVVTSSCDGRCVGEACECTQTASGRISAERLPASRVSLCARLGEGRARSSVAQSWWPKAPWPKAGGLKLVARSCQPKPGGPKPCSRKLVARSWRPKAAAGSQCGPSSGTEGVGLTQSQESHRPWGCQAAVGSRKAPAGHRKIPGLKPWARSTRTSCDSPSCKTTAPEGWSLLDGVHALPHPGSWPFLTHLLHTCTYTTEPALRKSSSALLTCWGAPALLTCPGTPGRT